MQDEDFMRRAILLAFRGRGYVSPNPMVGAVLMHEGRIIGEGWHERYGEAHAEVACFNSVMESERQLIPQSTMYVTLEPCAHRGKQPPCAHRLVQEHVKRVVVAIKDPFPEVSGRGIAILREAGIDVKVGCCEPEARWMCRRFLSVQEKGRPYVVLKWAQSADGYMAPSDRSRIQLSNHFSQTLVHRWRTEESAIMVGYKTALADNPQLTARLWQGPQPLRIFPDRHLKLPATHHLLDNATPTWVLNSIREQQGITSFLKLPFDESFLGRLLNCLKEAGKNSLFVEGGAKLLSSFIIGGLWDEARVFTTLSTIGAGVRAPHLNQARLAGSALAGDDTLQLWQPAESHFPYTPGAIF